MYQERTNTDDGRENDEKPSANPLRLRIQVIRCSLLGGNSNHVTTNCANPQLRNAQLPGNVVSLYACANLLRFLCGVCACVRSHVHSRACSCVNLSSYNTCLLPVKLELWETIQPVKTWNKFSAMLFHPTLQ